MKKVLSVLAGAVLLFGSAGVALAYTPLDYTFNLIDTVNGAISSNVPAPFYPDNGDFFFTDPTTGMAGFLGLDTSSPLQIVGNQLTIGQFPDYKIWDVDNGVPLENTILSLSAATTSLQNQINTANTNIGLLGAPLNIATFMGSNASTSPYIASSTQNGFMSAAMAIKVAALTIRSMATTTRSIVTGTGATGFQISSSRDAEVRYSTTIVTTSNIAGSQNGTVVLEIAQTNSATAADWSEIGRCTNGTAYTLAIAIQGVSTQACQITGYIPAGYFAKLRSINNAGTPTFSFNSSQEVLQ